MKPSTNHLLIKLNETNNQQCPCVPGEEAWRLPFKVPIFLCCRLWYPAKTPSFWLET
jgi:hypothetical protein